MLSHMDRHLRRNAHRDRVAGPAVELDALAVLIQHDAGDVRVILFEVDNLDPTLPSRRASSIDVGEQIVRHRPDFR